MSKRRTAAMSLLSVFHPWAGVPKTMGAGFESTGCLSSLFWHLLTAAHSMRHWLSVGHTGR